MIKVKDSVPSIYYEESRDFQVFGNSFEAVFNYLKTNVDLINENPLDRRSSYLVIKLITKTLGFESKHEYDMDDLRTLCSIFVDCIKNKGTLNSINKAISGLLNSQHITSEFKVIQDGNDLMIYLPKNIRDTVLLDDIFDYILPAGITYNFSFGTYALENKIDTEMSADDYVVVKEMKNANLGTTVYSPNTPHENKTTPEDLENYTSETKLSQTFTGTVADKGDNNE